MAGSPGDEAIDPAPGGEMDCFVASRLAMTGRVVAYQGTAG